MPATFTPYLENRLGHTVTDSDAYLRVRVPNGPRPDGSVVVYLSDGTALVVNGHQLLVLATRPNDPNS